MDTWKRVKVRLVGLTPLLMHSAQNMQEQGMVKNPTKNYDHTEYAESVAYRTDKGKLFVPSRCVKRAMINGSAWFKIGKKSAKQIIAGLTRIEPEEIVIKNSKGKEIKDYIIDKQPVVVNRARIIRARPKIEEWQLEFEILYDTRLIVPDEHLKTILEEAGMRIGLLDNRPQTYGENGTFKLDKFEVLK